MGRKPTPTNLKILKGNPGKRPLPKDEPIPRPIMPEPPNHLCEVAKQEWEKICPGLYTAGILTEIDKAIVSAYCTSYAIWEKSWVYMKSLETKENPVAALIIKTTNGNIIQHPIVGIANKAALDMIKYASELGMTPASRTRIKTNGNKTKEEADKYFT